MSVRRSENSEVDWNKSNKRRPAESGSRGARARAPATAIAVLDVENGSQATAVGCWVGAFEEGDVLDGVRVERGEHAEGMGGIVQAHLVEHDTGLVWPAPAHVETAAVVRRRLHAGEEMEIAQ